MKETTERLERVIDNLADGVIAFDERGHVEWMNPAARLMFQCAALDARGGSIRRWIPNLHELLELREPQAGRMGKGAAIVRHVTEGHRADGSVFPLELTVTMWEHSGVPCGTCVCRDVTDAQRVESIKSEFVSMVSHELRTPLTSLRAALALLTQDVIGPLPKDAARLLVLARDNGERLVRLVNDILDFEQLRAGAMSIRFQTCNLVEVLHDSVRAVEATAQQADVRVQLKVDDESMSLPVAVDPRRLEQVLLNLLANAIQHTARGGCVRMSVNVLSERVRVRIQDEGAGVPADFLPRLFEPFAQAGQGAGGHRRGTGLGLAISRDLMRLMHGGIGVDTPCPGEGAVFWVELPINVEPMSTLFQAL